MKYCVDTGFLLDLFNGVRGARAIVEDTRAGKTRLVIPTPVFAETVRKLLQRGVSADIISSFFDATAASDKITIIALEEDIAFEAAKMSTTYSLHLADAYAAATCLITGCDALLTSDKDYQNAAKRKYIIVKGW